MTKSIKVKNLYIGGGAPITVQSMTNTDTLDSDATLAQLKSLQAAGCDIARIAVSSQAEVDSVKNVIGKVDMPLVADIQFDYKLAIACAEIGFDKIRINPGNIGSDDRVKAVADACRAAGIPIRVGVNLGSISDDYLTKFTQAEALAKCAIDNVARLEKFGFDNIVISAKASSVRTSFDAYKIIAKSCDYPLHIGITESGASERGVVRSALGVGALLLSDIGDTLRVSLSGDPMTEVRVARMFLQEAGLDENFCEIVSCPTCSRCKYDLSEIVAELKEYTKDIKTPLKVAVMGCVVNGPGEARDCDFGVAGGGKDKAMIFVKGKAVRTVSTSEVVSELKKMIDAAVTNE